ncbi:hypothetical protein Hanom_Chr05g00390101 [Helianthus anomalus]
MFIRTLFLTKTEVLVLGSFLYLVSIIHTGILTVRNLILYSLSFYAGILN